MINTETIKGSVRIHGVRTLTAEAGPDDPILRDSAAWLTIKTQHNDEIVLFMPYEIALAYAFAINTVNDREAVEKSDLEPSHEEQTMLEKYREAVDARSGYNTNN